MTVKHAIAGFIAPDAGAIVLNGRDITTVPVNRRRLGVMFQDYALFPHMSAIDNVAFGLRVSGMSVAEQRSGRVCFCGWWVSNRPRTGYRGS